jgi:peptidoglycan hydrolase-like protein with peptidoglycan-binding domain
MRRAVTRTAVSAAAIISIAAGSLAGASTGFAASQPAAVKISATTGNVSILAVNNLGLSISEGKSVQCYVRDASPRGRYNPGTIDGQLGTNSWKAWQLFLNDRGYNAGTVDGAVGPNTIRALQKFLVDIGYDTGGIDGVAGTKTRAAWKAFSHLPSDGSWC